MKEALDIARETGAAIGSTTPQETRSDPRIERQYIRDCIDISAAKAVPGLQARSVTIPAAPDQPITVGYVSNGAIAATVTVDPYRGTVLSVRDPSQSFLAWMRPVHQGTLGVVWKFLVFLSGLVPSLFLVTGLVMWWKKRQRHVPMSEPLPEGLTGEEAA